MFRKNLLTSFPENLQLPKNYTDADNMTSAVDCCIWLP